MSKDRAAQLVEAGIWLKLSGDREGARKLFERALKLDPENDKAAQLLAGAPAPGENEQPEPPSPVPPPPVVPVAVAASNPFERQVSSAAGSASSASDQDWGMATGFKSAQTPAPSLDSDWGRLTGASTPAPQPMPPGLEPKPTAPDWASSGSGQTRQTLQGWGVSSSSNIVLGGSPSPTPQAAPVESSRQTLSAWGQSPLPQAAPPAPAPKQTLHGWGSSSTGLSEQVRSAAQTISLSGVAPPESPPRSTPPLFTAPAPAPDSAPRVVHIGGDAGPEIAPPSTPPLFGSMEPPRSMEGDLEPPPSSPPLFASPPAEPPPPAPPPEETPGELPRTVTEPMGFAWSWSASTPQPRAADPELPPEPRPSPSLAPRAESAWDNRSNPGIKLEAVVGQDRALDLISSDSKVTKSPDSRKDEIRSILRGARDLLELDDHTGAMELILKAQHIAPDDPDVLAMRDRSEKTLLNMFESKLGKLETIPRVLLKDDEIIWLNLDHRAGFVLAQIDGTVNFDDLFSVSGMSRIDTARILAQLVEEGVISRG